MLPARRASSRCLVGLDDVTNDERGGGVVSCCWVGSMIVRRAGECSTLSPMRDPR
jgi:hypothetical protein